MSSMFRLWRRPRLPPALYDRRSRRASLSRLRRHRYARERAIAAPLRPRGQLGDVVASAERVVDDVPPRAVGLSSDEFRCLGAHLETLRFERPVIAEQSDITHLNGEAGAQLHLSAERHEAGPYLSDRV